MASHCVQQLGTKHEPKVFHIHHCLSSVLLKETSFSRIDFGVTIGGEFSSAVNDCGTFLRGVNSTSTNTQCAEYVDWKNYNESMKAGILNWGEASMDALGDWFFW